MVRDRALGAADALSQEIELVEVAVEMVARGASPRVTVAGLRFGDRLLDAARSAAAARGVDLVPLWDLDRNGVSIQVERHADA